MRIEKKEIRKLALLVDGVFINFEVTQKLFGETPLINIPPASRANFPVFTESARLL